MHLQLAGLNQQAQCSMSAAQNMPVNVILVGQLRV